MAAPFVNQLAWSHSRAKSFRACARAYWFQYYGSWNGWRADAPAEVRDAYLQKKLTTRAMWIGTVVHEAAERGILGRCSGQHPTVDEARNWARTTARRHIEDSASGAWLARPSQRVGFSEHYYGEDIPAEAWDAAVDTIDQQVQALYEQRLYRRVFEVPHRVREVEKAQLFRVGDAAVWVTLDLLMDDGKGGVVILDWKTGAHHDDADIGAQLGAYGLYATQELGVPEDRITALHVNLRHGTETRHDVGPAEIGLARTTIAADTAAMRAPLRDVAANVAHRDDFPPLPEDAPACRRCNFRKVCGRASPRSP